MPAKKLWIRINGFRGEKLIIGCVISIVIGFLLLSLAIAFLLKRKRSSDFVAASYFDTSILKTIIAGVGFIVIPIILLIKQ